MIFVFTGNGKGKTTAAIGMGLRASGARKKVLMVQFLKDGSSSEIDAIKKIKNFQTKSFGRSGFGPYSEKDSRLAQLAFAFAKSAQDRSASGGKAKNCDLLILDEINTALRWRLLDPKEVIEFLKRCAKKLDVVLTGRYCPKEIIGMADLVTEFKEVKHYFHKDVKARKGIEI